MTVTQETIRKHFANAKKVMAIGDDRVSEVKHPIKIHRTVPGIICIESVNKSELIIAFNNGEYAEITETLGKINELPKPLTPEGYIKLIDYGNFENDSIMTGIESDFEENVDKTLAEIKELLLVKGKEYRRNNNPYHNFEKGAEMSGETPEKVLYGFQMKHLVSMSDIRDDISKGILPSEKMVSEKWNDALVYTLIEKCMILNRIKK